MKKKIFVNRDAHSGFRSSLKFLLWAAIGLVVLVLFIPLTSRQKPGKEVAKKAPAEKGKVVKEIPRSLQPIAESISRGQGESPDAPKEPEPRPNLTPEGKGSGAISATAPATGPKEKPAEPSAVPQKVEPAGEGGQKNLGGRPSSPEPAPVQTVKEGPAAPAPQPAPVAGSDAAKVAEAPPAKKPEPAAPSSTEAKPKAVAAIPASVKPGKPAGSETGATTAAPGQKLYTVQVATLKDKRSAEELKRTLQKKGFEVVMKTTGDPKQGQSFTLQLQPVDNIGKASTMMEQVKYVPQTKPSIVTVQPGN